jgi:hypothetical protein
MDTSKAMRMSQKIAARPLPHMPERVRRIQHAIQRRSDFTVLRNGGERAVQEYGRSIGMAFPLVLVTKWQQNYDLRKSKPVVDEPPPEPDDPLEPDDEPEDGDEEPLDADDLEDDDDEDEENENGDDDESPDKKRKNHSLYTYLYSR